MKVEKQVMRVPEEKDRIGNSIDVHCFREEIPIMV